MNRGGVRAKIKKGGIFYQEGDIMRWELCFPFLFQRRTRSRRRWSRQKLVYCLHNSNFRVGEKRPWKKKEFVMALMGVKF
jgi:hypothetical protein